MIGTLVCICFFFFNDTATTEIYTLSLHELFRSLAKEIVAEAVPLDCGVNVTVIALLCPAVIVNGNDTPLRVNSDVLAEADEDRKSTRLNSSHLVISYAVFCLKKKINSSSRI